jgi:expansin (peptidoglycan-binding protein)
VAATNSWPCGTALRVCTATACVTVTVRDKGGMAANEIDLSPAGFAKLASLSAGQITATAEVVGQ